MNPDLSKRSSESLGLSWREKHLGRWHRSLRNSALDYSLTLVKWWGLSNEPTLSYGIALNHNMRPGKVSVPSSACHGTQRLRKSPHAVLQMGRETARINCTFNVLEQKEYIIV